VGPRTGLDRCGKLKFRSPDRLARSRSLYRLSYRGPPNIVRRVCVIAKMVIGFVMSVWPPAWSNSPPTGQNFMKVLSIFRKYVEKINSYLTRIAGTLHEDDYTLFIISRAFLLRMRNVSDQSYRGNKKKLYSVTLFRKSCLFFLR